VATADGIVRVEEDAAWLALAGPIVDAGALQTLLDACTEVGDDASVRVLVVTGAAAGTFVTGAVLRDEAEHGLAARAVAALAGLRTPTIAAIAGPAHAIGLEIALACDLRLAAADATFAMPQLAAGALPFCGGTQRLPRIVGRARALDLLLTGRIIDAGEAAAWGLVARRAAAATFAVETAALARDVAAGAPLAAALAKEALLAAHDLPLAEGLRLEEDLYALLQTSADRAEGIRAFLAGRTPRFAGR